MLDVAVVLEATFNFAPLDLLTRPEPCPDAVATAFIMPSLSVITVSINMCH